MAVSPSRSILYITRHRRVILDGLALILALTVLLQIGPTQVAHSAKVSKGPRALGLVELAPNGKAHLIPIAILYDGKFYDAGAYKASPVPMALESETVYEGIRSGVSQGLFTVTAALEQKTTNTWIAEGTWRPASSIPPKSANKPVAPSKPRGLDEDEGPPKLRRSGSEKAKPTETAPAPTAPTQTAASPATPPSAAGAPPNPSPAPSAPAVPAAATPASSAAPPADQPDKDQEAAAREDKDRPMLRRGKPTPKPEESSDKAPATASKASAHTATAPAASPASQIQLIPAISDADGPELRSYTYSLKPEEEQQFRKKTLALAADEIRARAKQLAGEMAASAPRSHASSSRARATVAKPVQPDFEDVQLRIFDLSNSNDLEAVLTAKARLPQRAGAKENSPGLQYFVTLVVREDVNGDLHKALANVTDSQHLDVLPRVELIDAVDADGDGRGELLFREVSDAGTAFVVYRVIGDRLWPLFQGTPTG
jgi:hypothetical protein